MNQSLGKNCPVPTDQQPVNEYQELTQSWFFQWATFPYSKYAGKLTVLGCISQLVVTPIAAASFSPSKATLGFILASFLGGSFFVALALLRLYLGWSYVGNRLNSEKIIYEESGWYDGQEWEKTPKILARDRLIFSHQVQPLLQRLQNSGLILLGLIVSGSFTFFWL
jgi:hypothetical protein